MTESWPGKEPATALFAGDGSLDFANSREDWERGYPQLLAWSQRAGLVSQRRSQAMRRQAEQAPDAARAALERAGALQAALHRIFWAVAHGETGERGDLARLNEDLARAMGKLRIERDGATYRWSWAEQDDALDRMLWPVARMAAELLQSPNLRWLKACSGEGCDRLFLDLSRNHSRRWCEMSHCGMLAKSRRHQAKQRAARRSDAV